MPDFTVSAPTDGQVVALEQVPDPAFAEKMLGDGLAINPSSHFVVAPFDAQVINLHCSLHAITLKNQQVEVLIHIGVDSVGLKGKGFEALVKTGDQVKRGQKLIAFDPDFLAQHTPCNWVITLVTSPEGTPVKGTPEKQVIAGQSVLFSLPGVQAAPLPQGSSVSENNWIYSRTVTISNPNGLHARPAAALGRAAKLYPFSIEIECAGKRANLKSLVAVMGLGLNRGTQVRLRANASAELAESALHKLADFLESGLGEQETDAAEQTPTKAAEPAPLRVSEDKNTFYALTACIGLAHGQSFQWRKQDITFPQTADSPSKEKAALNKVLQEVLLDINTQEKSASTTGKTILQAHKQLLQDAFLIDCTNQYIEQGKSAPAAFNEAIRASIDVLKNTQNRFLAERIADLKDVRRRILEKLTGNIQTRPQIPPRSILITDELLPSDMKDIDSHVQGVVMAYGSPTAHVSILLRNRGIPSVVSAGGNVLQIVDGTSTILNATEGVVQLNPTEKQLELIVQQEKKEKTEQELAQQAAYQPALTTDGVQIYISGNASNLQEAKAAQANGADGLGLVRTEFLFYKGTQGPTEQEQYDLYQQISSALSGNPVTLRTLDVGGDKPVSYMPIPTEENPIVGLRGVRNYARYRDIFLSQIRAMLRVTPTGTAHIMLPMVSFLQELVYYKHLIEEEKQKMGLSVHIPVGIMVEVPSAALQAEQLAEQADFFSIGTNDLTQYTLAIDRGHKTLCSQADALHPAVLRLIHLTCQGAAKYKKPVAVCGAIAGDLTAVPILMGLGVTELAVSSNLIAPIKALVRKLNHRQTVQLAEQALQCRDAQAVRALVKQTLQNNK